MIHSLSNQSTTGNPLARTAFARFQKKSKLKYVARGNSTDIVMDPNHNSKSREAPAKTRFTTRDGFEKMTARPTIRQTATVSSRNISYVNRYAHLSPMIVGKFSAMRTVGYEVIVAQCEMKG